MPDILGNGSTNSTLIVGGSTTSTIDSIGDHDWFSVNLTAGVQITVTVYGITLVDPFLNLRDSSGAVIASNDDIKAGSDRNSLITFTPTTSGVYYIDVGAFGDTYQGTYQVSLQPGTQPPIGTVDTIAGFMVQGAWGGDSHHFGVTQGGTITVNLSTLNASEQNLARTALHEWSDIIGVTFQEVTTGGQITFDNTEATAGTPVAQTDVSYSNGITTSAHVQISTSWVNKYGTALNTYSFQTYLHEIGHALGLGHTGDYDGTATYGTDALFQNDGWPTSIMSYFDQAENSYFAGQGFTRMYVATPMEADIAGMQTLYGLSSITRTGNTIYGFNSNAGGVYNASQYSNVAVTIYDSGGTDTIDYSASGANQLINLNQESFSNVNGRTGNLEIARGTVIENAISGSGADTLIGNDAANILTGGLGADRLTGGAGADSFSDTIAGHNGDTIVDFSSDDKIVFTDASAGFTFSLSGNVLTFTGGSLTLSTVPTGTIVASAAAGGGVQLTISATTPTATRHVHNDFNGDGISDILWRHDNGAIFDFLGQPNGAFTNNGDNIYTVVDTSWHMAGTGDFNGDGRADILWRNDSGAVFDFLGKANGGVQNNGDNSYMTLQAGWSIVGIGDFNGDGRSDILVRNAGGTITDYLGNASGGFAINNNNLFTTVGLEWQVAGTGDFNGDGRDDILWRNTSNGAIFDFLGTSTGGMLNNGDNIYTVVDMAWHFAGTGDFNGDGRADILWRNDSGAIFDFLGKANGGVQNNGDNSWTAASPGLQVASIGDFNGDHRADILWRDSSGTITDWLGTSVGGFSPNGNTLVPVGTQWHVQDTYF